MEIGAISHGKLGRFALAILLGITAASTPAFAWNDEGHMAVAYLAYQRLQPATRNRVDALLALNPYYSRWSAAIPAGTSEADTKMAIFMIAATWPDQLRNDPTYNDDGSNGGNTPAGPESTQNIGYSDHLRHKYWHFIDIPFSQDGSPLPPVPAPNAQTQIAAFRKTLRSGRPDNVKSYDLAWLEHLEGDVHQPLHAIMRVSAGMLAGDAGGNLVALCSSPCSESLHLFWDRLVGSQSVLPQSLPATESSYAQPDLWREIQSALAAAKALPNADPRQVQQTKESVWVRESFDYARRYVYVPPIGNGAGPFTVTQEYLETARDLAKKRIALAGARLANLLNNELR